MVKSVAPGEKSRILFLYNNDPSPGLIEIAQLLENSGKFESHLVFWHRDLSDISIPFSTELPTDRIHQISLPDPRGNPFRRTRLSIQFALRLRRVIKTIRPHVIYAVNPDMLGFTNIALIGIRSVGVTYDFQDQKGTKLNFVARNLYRLILRKARFVLIRSEGFRKQIESESLVAPSTPVEYLAEAPANWNEPAPRTVTVRDHMIVGYFGNIRGRTQLSNLIEAVKKLRESGRDVRLRFAGGGPDAAWLKSSIRQLDYIECSGPFDYFREYKPMFESADVIHAVYPLDWANYYTHEARRFHEAIAAGIPIIVSSGTHMAQRVKDLGVGWTVESESAQELFTVLSNAYDNENERRNMIAGSEVRRMHQLETYEPLLVRAIEMAMDPG